MTQWKELIQTDFYRLLIDETRLEDPYVEIADEIGDPGFNVYRVELERYKVEPVQDGDTVTAYLVPYGYASDWPALTISYEPWFADDLGSIAESSGETREDLISQLCSEDPQERLGAYLAIGGHWGWENFDSYPLVLSREELDERLKVLPAKTGPTSF